MADDVVGYQFMSKTCEQASNSGRIGESGDPLSSNVYSPNQTMALHECNTGSGDCASFFTSSQSLLQHDQCGMHNSPKVSKSICDTAENLRLLHRRRSFDYIPQESTDGTFPSISQVRGVTTRRSSDVIPSSAATFSPTVRRSTTQSSPDFALQDQSSQSDDENTHLVNSGLSGVSQTSEPSNNCNSLNSLITAHNPSCENDMSNTVNTRVRQGTTTDTVNSVSLMDDLSFSNSDSSSGSDLFKVTQGQHIKDDLKLTQTANSMPNVCTITSPDVVNINHCDSYEANLISKLNNELQPNSNCTGGLGSLPHSSSSNLTSSPLFSPPNIGNSCTASFSCIGNQTINGNTPTCTATIGGHVAPDLGLRALQSDHEQNCGSDSDESESGEDSNGGLSAKGRLNPLKRSLSHGPLRPKTKPNSSISRGKCMFEGPESPPRLNESTISDFTDTGNGDSGNSKLLLTDGTSPNSSRLESGSNISGVGSTSKSTEPLVISSDTDCDDTDDLIVVTVTKARQPKSKQEKSVVQTIVCSSSDEADDEAAKQSGKQKIEPVVLTDSSDDKITSGMSASSGIFSSGTSMVSAVDEQKPSTSKQGHWDQESSDTDDEQRPSTSKQGLWDQESSDTDVSDFDCESNYYLTCSDNGNLFSSDSDNDISDKVTDHSSNSDSDVTNNVTKGHPLANLDNNSVDTVIDRSSNSDNNTTNKVQGHSSNFDHDTTNNVKDNSSQFTYESTRNALDSSSKTSATKPTSPEKKCKEKSLYPNATQFALKLRKATNGTWMSLSNKAQKTTETARTSSAFSRHLPPPSSATSTFPQHSDTLSDFPSVTTSSSNSSDKTQSSKSFKHSISVPSGIQNNNDSSMNSLLPMKKRRMDNECAQSTSTGYAHTKSGQTSDMNANTTSAVSSAFSNVQPPDTYTGQNRLSPTSHVSEFERILAFLQSDDMSSVLDAIDPCIVCSVTLSRNEEHARCSRLTSPHNSCKSCLESQASDVILDKQSWASVVSNNPGEEDITRRCAEEHALLDTLQKLDLRERKSSSLQGQFVKALQWAIDGDLSLLRFYCSNHLPAAEFAALDEQIKKSLDGLRCRLALGLVSLTGYRAPKVYGCDQTLLRGLKSQLPKLGAFHCPARNCSAIINADELKKVLPEAVVRLLEEKYKRRTLPNQTKEMPPEPKEPKNDYPESWSAMDESKEYELVPVSADTAEYNVVLAQFHDTLHIQFFRVTSVKRVQNPTHWKICQLKKEKMKRANRGEAPLEMTLFHGTSPDVVEQICQDNFDWRMCGKNGTAFGQGSYFALDARYSHGYSMKRNQLSSLAQLGLNPYFNQSGSMNLNPAVALGHQPPFLSGNINPPTFPNRPGQSGFMSLAYLQHQNLRSALNLANTSHSSSLLGPSTSGTSNAMNNPSGANTSSNTMFLARVLVGRYCRGSAGDRKPPHIEGSTDPVRYYDSCVDDVNNPRIFVIFDSSQTYPEYVIEYMPVGNATPVR